MENKRRLLPCTPLPCHSDPTIQRNTIFCLTKHRQISKVTVFLPSWVLKFRAHDMTWHGIYLRVIVVMWSDWITKPLSLERSDIGFPSCRLWADRCVSPINALPQSAVIFMWVSVIKLCNGVIKLSDRILTRWRIRRQPLRSISIEFPRLSRSAQYTLCKTYNCCRLVNDEVNLAHVIKAYDGAELYLFYLHAH